MAKRHLTSLFAVVLVVLLSTLALAQTAARWEGFVTRTSKQKSTLTVRKRGSTSPSDEKDIHYDSSTKFQYQPHGEEAKDIDPSEVKEGDRVICVGYIDEKGVFQAGLVSKRLKD